MITSMISSMIRPMITSMVNPDSTKRTFIDLDPSLKSHYLLANPIILEDDFEVSVNFTAGASVVDTYLTGQFTAENYIRVNPTGNIRFRLSDGVTTRTLTTSGAYRDGDQHTVRYGVSEGQQFIEVDRANYIETPSLSVYNYGVSIIGARDVLANYFNGILSDVSINSPANISMRAIQARIQEGYTAGTGYNYIITGDSTRDTSYNDVQSYYSDQLAKVNWSTTDNALSGQDSTEWVNDVYAPNNGLTAAINATPNTGLNTILEYSMGINDGGGKSTRKAAIKLAVETYIAAKPDALIILVTPVVTADTNATQNLLEIYQELSVELGLAYIDVQAITGPVHGGPYPSDYYQDSTHPNNFGSARFINWNMSRIMPPNLFPLITLDEIGLSDLPTGNISEPVESGLWNSTTGDPQANSGWRRMQPVTVIPDEEITITHGGDRDDGVLMDSGGSRVGYVTVGNGVTYNVPSNVAEIRLNISSSGASYDALNDTPTIFYTVPEDGLTQAEINAGVTLEANVLATTENTLFKLDRATGNAENSRNGNNSLTYIDIPETNRESFNKNASGNWDNISPDPQVLPASIEVA